VAVYREQDRDDLVKEVAAEARILGEARMLRDDQPLTPQLTDAIIARFRELLARIERSETWAARAMGIAASTLSQILNGKYEGDTESRIRQIDKWTELKSAGVKQARPAGFAKTSVALAIIGAAKGVVKQPPEEPRIAVCHGPSGIGKSLTADFLLSEITGALYIRITTAGCGIPAIYDMLSTALKLPPGRLTAYQKELAVKEVLRDSDRLIIVDEVHKLCKRGKDHGLHVLRDLQDATKCPMLWLGTADVATYIENGREAIEAVEQIYGRVAVWLDMSYAASLGDDGDGLHSTDDIRKVLNAQQIRVTPDAEKELWWLANQPKMGGLRTIVGVCRWIQRNLKLGDRPITVDMLNDAQGDRLGKRAAKMVQSSIDTRKLKRRTG